MAQFKCPYYEDGYVVEVEDEGHTIHMLCPHCLGDGFCEDLTADELMEYQRRLRENTKR